MSEFVPVILGCFFILFGAFMLITAKNNVEGWSRVVHGVPPTLGGIRFLGILFVVVGTAAFILGILLLFGVFKGTTPG